MGVRVNNNKSVVAGSSLIIRIFIQGSDEFFLSVIINQKQVFLPFNRFTESFVENIWNDQVRV